MKKITYVDPLTFESKEFECNEHHYKLTEDLKEFLEKKHKVESNSNIITDIVYNPQNENLAFGFFEHSKEEPRYQKYKIIIEKLEDYGSRV